MVVVPESKMKPNYLGIKFRYIDIAEQIAVLKFSNRKGDTPGVGNVKGTWTSLFCQEVFHSENFSFLLLENYMEWKCN